MKRYFQDENTGVLIKLELTPPTCFLTESELSEQLKMSLRELNRKEYAALLKKQ